MRNVGRADRIVREAAGAGLLSMLLVVEGPRKYAGLLGKVNTCRVSGHEESVEERKLWTERNRGWTAIKSGRSRDEPKSRLKRNQK
ncbi:hypothetical protein PV433_32545 [Paenibacillus sp. GYB004]|uniref:hypothetical protein n=1 Tax=Paenibacillus sp. GYB004 TaxID=2994393 RepID=UPI002F9648E3